jgi:phosphotriesterase-related protein
MSAITVLGAVPASDLGVVCPHEHVLIDLQVYLADRDAGDGGARRLTIDTLGAVRQRPELVHDNYVLDDLAIAVQELDVYRRAGGGTIVDVTLDDIGRSPESLVEISARTGVHIVMGTGYYIHQSHPPAVAALTVGELAAVMIREIVEGVGTTPVRAGIIGELGTSPVIHPDEEKVLRAGARAQLETGAAISVHAASATRHAIGVLEILQDEGLEDLSRTIISHQDACLDLDYHLAVLERGAIVEFDLFGHHYYDDAFGGYWMPGDGERVQMLKTLLDLGFSHQLLVSQDVCLKMLLKTYGGNGYSYISEWIEPRMAAAGVSRADIIRMRIENPARLLDVF